MPESFKPLSTHLNMCKICYIEDINTIFLPCKHQLFCIDCKDLLKEAVCPLCGASLTDCVRLYTYT